MVSGDPPSPKPLAERLGIRPGMTVAVDGLDDPSLIAEVRARGGRVFRRRAGTRADIVLVHVAERRALSRLATLRGSIGDTGAIWVVFPRRRQDLRDTDVMAAARDAGLIDNKVARFNDTDTSIRLVVPVALRGGARR